ncbi:MAG TPA: hypothetical protein VHE30_09015 [Polyangiaceae bacterium]|nr:hypothetical protein [Polyangiaceae bacterium]
MEDTDTLERPKSTVGKWVMVLGISIPLAMAAGVGIGVFAFAPPKAPPPVASAAPKCPPPPPSAAPPTTTVEKAAVGDYKALDELKAKAAADRSAEETLALARGRSHNKGAALEGFAAEIKKNADLLSNKDQLARLKEFFLDRETTNQAAAIIAGLPGTLGPDLLYDVFSSTRNKNDTTQLCEDLLATKDLRDKASPALLVTLDLRKAEKCEEFKDLLPKVHDTADRRALGTLAKLQNKRGCGDNKLGDCYECLRPLEKDKEAIDVVKATKAAAKRPAPKLF